MALKFLNKKGWHTGSLRNIENVWKAEQKHEAEQKKLEELRKQIQDERERSEFRLLQEQAGLLPKQERLDFLYDSGLAVGKASGSDGGGGGGFKTLDEALPSNNKASDPSSSSMPGALFEDKPHSANDAWRKLHSDPLLLIRQREQEALARVKNNPVQMALIRKSVEEKKPKEKARHKKEHLKKHHHSSSKHHKHSSSRRHSDSVGAVAVREKEQRKETSGHRSSNRSEQYPRPRPDSDDESSERESRKKKCDSGFKRCYHSPSGHSAQKRGKNEDEDSFRRNSDMSNFNCRTSCDIDRKERVNRKFFGETSNDPPSASSSRETRSKHQNVAPKLSEEERAARLQEMQVDAQVHEEQRWKRLRKAEEDDAGEAARASTSGGRNFLDAVKRSVFGAEKGGSSTIEESVRRRTHYSQRRSEAGEGNAFRR